MNYKIRLIPNSRGLSVTDLLFATTLFSLVSVTLFSLSASFTRVAYGTLRGDVKLDMMSVITARTMQKETYALTRIATPGSGTSAGAFEGFLNLDDNGNPINGLPVNWFAFCIQPAATGFCTGPAGTNPAPCLFHHRGAGNVIPAIECGVSGGVIQILASGVDCSKPAANCFTRSSDGQKVRAAFTLTSKVDPVRTKSLSFDTTYGGQFGF